MLTKPISAARFRTLSAGKASAIVELSWASNEDDASEEPELWQAQADQAPEPLPEELWRAQAPDSGKRKPLPEALPKPLRMLDADDRCGPQHSGSQHVAGTTIQY